MKHRLFIAIDLPEATLSEIAILQSQLEKLALPLVWEKQPLLILNFLGLADPGAITPLIPPFHSFTLSPLYLDTLYSRHDPTILYLSLAKSEELLQLQASVSSSISSITPQPRHFLLHISIGKLKRTDPVSTKRAIDIISNQEVPVLSEFLVDHVTLYKSLLSRTGSTYQKLATFSALHF